MVSITRCRVRIACLLALICSWPGAPLAQPGPRPDPKAVIPPRAKGAPKRAPKRAPKPALPAFQQQWLTPYLQQGKVAAARQALVARKPAEAARRLSRYLARKDAPWRLQARFLLGHAYLRTGRYRKAAKLFGALWRQYPLLADYHLFYEARARYRLKEYQACVSLTAKVAVTSALATDASLLRADALRRLGRVEEAAGLWKRYLDAGAGKRRRGEAHFRLGQAKEKEAAGQTTAAKRRALQARAMRHYKQVLVLSPGSRLEAPARRGIAALAARGAGKVKLSPWEAYGRASVFFRRMRNRTSERAFARLLRRKKLAKKLRCMASYRMARSVFKQRQRARAEPMYRKAAAACRAAGLTDMVVKSLYSGARGLSRGRKFRKAIARYGLIEKEFSKHSYADDARLRAAEVYVEMGNKRAARKLLATIPSRYPDGDMIREALWRLARDAYQARRYKKATRYLDRIIKRLGRATIYYAHGRALYWKARIQQKRKRSAAARKLYARCIREYPLSYYALQSFNRLREGHRATFAKLVKKHIDGTGLKPGRWTFAARALFAKPSFLRGVELARLGFGNDAARELAAAGIKIKKGVKPEDMWLAAVLYDRAGIWRNSHQVPRSKDMRYRWKYPLGENYRRWTISYPRAFWPLVQVNARAAGIPWQMVLAVMREESGFNPTVESYANAVGLMQLIMPTARAAGKRFGITISRKVLHDPAVNIKLGATYLGSLHRLFSGVLPLAINGYNAGGGAPKKWIKRFGKIPLDEFLERVPYDQTRRYTKRVLASLFIYSTLYEKGQARIPVIGQRIPWVPGLKAKKAKKAKKKRKKARKKKKPKKMKTPVEKE